MNQELIDSIQFMSKAGELILQMRYDLNQFDLEKVLGFNMEQSAHRDGQFGFVLRQEYYGFTKQLSEAFLRHGGGPRYFNIQFFLQRKADGQKFLIENWSFELKEIIKNSKQSFGLVKKNNISKLLVHIKDKVKKDELNLNLSILVRQIAIILTQSSLWKDYLQIDKDDMLFQAFRYKHFLDYKLSYKQQNFDLNNENQEQQQSDQWISKDSVRTQKLKVVQIGANFLLESQVSYLSDMSLVRKVPLQTKHQIQNTQLSNNYKKKQKRERFLSDNIFSEDDSSNTHNNNNQDHNGTMVGHNANTHQYHKNNTYSNNTFKFGKQEFKKKGLTKAGNFLSCDKLNVMEEQELLRLNKKNKNSSDLNSDNNKTVDRKISVSKKMQQRRKVAENKSLLCSDFLQKNRIDQKDIEIVQNNHQYGQDSIISMYSKKDDITIISTPEDLKISNPNDDDDEDPFNTDDEEDNEDDDLEFGQQQDDNIEFELCGIMESNEQSPNKLSLNKVNNSNANNKIGKNQSEELMDQQQQEQQLQGQYQQQYQKKIASNQFRNKRQQKLINQIEQYEQERNSSKKNSSDAELQKALQNEKKLELYKLSSNFTNSQQKEQFKQFMDGIIQSMEIYFDEIQDEPIVKAQEDLQTALEIFQ